MMKTSFLIYGSMTVMAFLGSYFLRLTAENFEQYLAIVGVVFLDGFFGVWAGTQTVGFQTKRALRVLVTLFLWLVILTVTLMIEKGFKGTFWLSETLCAPFIIFQLISSLKNMHTVGLIPSGLLSDLLYKIDQHKFDHGKSK